MKTILGFQMGFALSSAAHLMDHGSEIAVLPLAIFVLSAICWLIVVKMKVGE